jgi:hypothetical protein
MMVYCMLTYRHTVGLNTEWYEINANMSSSNHAGR